MTQIINIEESNNKFEIFGIGTDLIETIRIKEAINKYPKFLQKIYTDNEIKYCELKKINKYQSYASRFAAKEAVAKSVNVGLGRLLFFNEIEIINSDSGLPYVNVFGKSLLYFLANNIVQIRISLSSTKNYCVAYAISLTKK